MFVNVKKIFEVLRQAPNNTKNLLAEGDTIVNEWTGAGRPTPARRMSQTQ